jgi:cation diffusion facilitator CzcD-associated flavoprotein CzcO
MSSFDWLVIGAGPAGIATVGKLIDNNIHPDKIAWLDPEFKVGDFGTRWCNVASNTRVKLFLRFFSACKAFEFDQCQEDFPINQADPDKTCLLNLATAPLQWITERLKQKVNVIVGKALNLKLHDRHWNITLANETIRAKNVVVATGSEPKSLAYPGITEIPLTTALDPEKLKAVCTEQDTIAVFGSSHSGILILRSLLEKCSINKVINFHFSPLRYAVYYPDWILFDDTGLKGTTAEWARDNIDGILPAKLERVISHEDNLRALLPTCTKAIYATGFQRRLIPVEGMHTLEYNDRSGIIAPGLFGVGIAFPEAKVDRFGTLEYRVGLWKFMEYINNVVPVWLNYGT